MIIQPKIRGFICTAAHPQGCQRAVEEQIQYVARHDPLSGPKRVLIIGASTGYGLASRIVTAFGMHAQTIGVAYEKPADQKRTASPGWYNTAAFEHAAHAQGLYAKSINGDAFSTAIKQQVADLIATDLGQIDCIIYSLASPRRIHPASNVTYASVLKPIGQPYTGKTVDAFSGDVKEVTLTPATDAEINDTVAVMGGEDWALWIEYLKEKHLLAEGCITLAYSYIGPELTYPIYKEGTIGRAKDHLKETADALQYTLSSCHGHARVVVNKALVTQASAAIPVVPLYISLLYRLMKQAGTHEGCIEQIYRLFKDHYATIPTTSAKAFIRIDDYEMAANIQEQVRTIWPDISSENVETLTDIEGYRHAFHQLFGFEFSDIDYEADVDPVVHIPSLHSNL